MRERSGIGVRQRRAHFRQVLLLTEGMLGGTAQEDSLFVGKPETHPNGSVIDPPRRLPSARGGITIAILGRGRAPIQFRGGVVNLAGKRRRFRVRRPGSSPLPRAGSRAQVGRLRNRLRRLRAGVRQTRWGRAPLAARSVQWSTLAWVATGRERPAEFGRRPMAAGGGRFRRGAEPGHQPRSAAGNHRMPLLQGAEPV